MESGNSVRYVTTAVVWAYLISVILAKRFWAGVYERLVIGLDLSPNQAWFLPITLNLAIAAIALPYVLKSALLIKQRVRFNKSQQITLLLCSAGMFVCIWGAASTALSKREQLRSAIRETAEPESGSILAAGVLNDGAYTNGAVGLSIAIPQGWYPMSQHAIERAKRSGARAAFGEGSEEEKAMAAARNGSYALLSVTKFAEPHDGYNPSLTLQAYKKAAMAAYGQHSLEDYADSFNALTAPFYLRSGPVMEIFGEANGYYLQLEVQYPQATIQQHVYITETDGLYVTLVASFMDDADLSALREAASTLRIKRRPL